MTIDWSISPAALWALAGVLLILSEFALPGVIAVFFGVAALLVAVLLVLGLPLSLNVQILIFGGLAVVLLLAARNRVRGWFRGRSEQASDGVEVLQAGVPVAAAADFADGRGVVTYRGARWNAELVEPDEAVAAGRRLWIASRHGLVLRVSVHEPAEGGAPRA